MKLPVFTTWQWVTIVGGLVVAGVSATSFAFNTFETKEEISRVYQTLDRIENKIDLIIEKRR